MHLEAHGVALHVAPQQRDQQRRQTLLTRILGAPVQERLLWTTFATVLVGNAAGLTLGRQIQSAKSFV